MNATARWSRSRKYLAADDRPARPRSRVYVRVTAFSIWRRKSILMEHIGWHLTGRTVPVKRAQLVAFTAAVPLYSSIATRNRRRIRPARIWRCLRSDYDDYCCDEKFVWCDAMSNYYLLFGTICWDKGNSRVDVWRTNSKLTLDCSFKPIQLISKRCINRPNSLITIYAALAIWVLTPSQEYPRQEQLKY